MYGSIAEIPTNCLAICFQADGALKFLSCWMTKWMSLLLAARAGISDRSAFLTLLDLLIVAVSILCHFGKISVSVCEAATWNLCKRFVRKLTEPFQRPRCDLDCCQPGTRLDFFVQLQVISLRMNIWQLALILHLKMNASRKFLREAEHDLLNILMFLTPSFFKIKMLNSSAVFVTQLFVVVFFIFFISLFLKKMWLLGPVDRLVAWQFLGHI